MEHRWGRRIPLKIPVQIFVGSRRPVLGEIENASISGALVQTSRPIPLWARVEVEMLQPARQTGGEPERVAAHVTRRTSDAVAIEWCDLAPHSVRVLIGAMEAVAARAIGPSADPTR